MLRTGRQISVSKVTSHISWIRTLGRLDIRRERQVPLHTDQDILKKGEVERGFDVVCKTLLEHDRCAIGETWVIGKGLGEGGSVIAPSRIRDDEGFVGESKRNER